MDFSGLLLFPALLWALSVLILVKMVCVLPMPPSPALDPELL